MEDKTHENSPEKVVIMHGFTKEQVFTLMRAVKREFGTQEDIAFAMTTARSLENKLADVVNDVAEEHAYMKKHPPGERPS